MSRCTGHAERIGDVRRNEDDYGILSKIFCECQAGNEDNL